MLGVSAPVRAPAVRAVPPPVARARVVAVQAKASKASEFRGMSDEEIRAAVKEAQVDMFYMRMKRATRQEYKPSEYKNLRRKVAQMLTVLREKELQQGVSKRDRRSAEKRALLEQGMLVQ